MTNIYGKLNAKDALDLWGKNRKAYAAKQQAGIPLTPDEQEDLDGNMTALAEQNPGAWKLLKVGANYRVDPSNSGEHVRDTFNAGTGEWETKRTKGYWDHPESWFQLIAGAGMAGLGAYAALGNAPAMLAPEIALTTGPATGVAIPTAAGLSAGAGGTVAATTLGTAATTAATTAAEEAAKKAAAKAASDAVTQQPGGAAWYKKLLDAYASGDSTAVQQLISTGASLYGLKLTNDANKAAADANAKAYMYGADLQDAAAKRTEQFLREQAENQYQNTEASRRGNYDQWRARENRLSTLSSTLGAGARSIPDYVPGVDPRYLNGSQTQTTDKTNTTPGGTTTNPGAPGNNNRTQVEPGGAQQGGTPPVDGTAATISAYFKSRGVSDHETAYWVSKWPELVARGKEINDPNYAMKRLAAADVFGGGGGGQTSTTQQQNPSTTWQYQPLLTGPMTPALSAPDAQHLQMPGSLGQLAQQQKWFY